MALASGSSSSSLRSISSATLERVYPASMPSATGSLSSSVFDDEEDELEAAEDVDVVDADREAEFQDKWKIITKMTAKLIEEMARRWMAKKVMKSLLGC